MMRFKKFKIIDIFKWQSQKEIDPLNIKNLKIDDEKKYPFYGQATQNNGIIDYYNLTDEVLNNIKGKPTILIHSNNQNIVYLESPFYLKDGHGATSVLQNEFLNELNAMYIISCIKKVIAEKFTYNEKATKIALKNTIIELPINDKGDVDYKYMENFMKKLKNDVINDVDEYICSVKLKDLKLSFEEATALKRYEGNDVKYKSFKFNELFYSDNGDTDIQQKDLKNKGHFVISSGEKNNGIIGKTDIKSKVFNENTITVDMFGYANFRDFKYKMVTHARVFSLIFKNKVLNTEEGLFLVSHMGFLREIFSYGDMASWEKLKNREICLPVNSDGKIEFDYINNFVRAKQKMVLNNFKM